jgi:hypothetical protein
VAREVGTKDADKAFEDFVRARSAALVRYSI